jgi:hypothetical protein
MAEKCPTASLKHKAQNRNHERANPKTRFTQKIPHTAMLLTLLSTYFCSCENFSTQRMQLLEKLQLE